MIYLSLKSVVLIGFAAAVLYLILTRSWAGGLGGNVRRARRRRGPVQNYEDMTPAERKAAGFHKIKDAPDAWRDFLNRR